MEGIKIEVTGNIARVTQKPTKLTSGTVGLPAEFTFDEQWDGLKKVAVFRAGDIKKTVDIPEGETIVPWEVMDKPKVWLSTGVYGVNDDGTVVIPTIWANVGVIRTGVDLEGDDPTDPTAPIWKTLTEEVEEAIQELREAIKNGDIVIPEGGAATPYFVDVQHGDEGYYINDFSWGDLHAEIGKDRMIVCRTESQDDVFYLPMTNVNDYEERVIFSADIGYNHHEVMVWVDGMVEYTVEDRTGDISTALDRIIEIQEELIGV